MSDVLLAACSGGIINLSLIEDLRGDRVTGDAKDLADIGLFTDQASGDAPTKSMFDNDIESAFGQAKSTWSALREEWDGDTTIEVTRLRERLILPLLRSLGFDPQYQRAHLNAGGGSFRISHLGWDHPDAPPILIEPGDLDAASGGRRSPHDEVQGYLNRTAARWGIVCNATHLRLVRDFHHTRTKGYVQFEIAAILTADSREDFLALYRMAHASRFEPIDPDAAAGDDDADCLLERLHQRSLTAGITAGKRLKPQVRRAIEHLAEGALSANPVLRHRLREEAGFGRVLYRELLSVLYRMLFLLFAEQRDMLRTASPLYEETYSITALRETAETGAYEGRRHDLWEGLKRTFLAFHDPDLAAHLGVYPFNGELFDPAHTPTLTDAPIPNSRLAAALSNLTTVQVGKVSLHVDYRNLGVEELGTVYESLLDYTLRIADRPVAVDGRKVTTGQVYLNPFSTERGDLASYYTPPPLVSLVLDRSLDPLIVNRLADAGTDPQVREDALLDIRVIDPAAGSAAFLIGAVDRLALAVARERTAPSEPDDRQVSIARRDVLSRCIYGADKDPFAVELAKVALWIHCAIPDAPLSFLDHHLVCGDSLVGWPLLDTPTRIETEAYNVPKGKVDKDTYKILNAAKSDNASYLAGQQSTRRTTTAAAVAPALPALLNSTDTSYTDVRAKATALAEYRDQPEVRHLRRVADLWTAAHFWSAEAGPAPTTGDYHDALEGTADAGLLDIAGSISRDLNPLHWSLAFPDIRDRGGFDLVIGNPPWEQFKGEGIEFFRDLRPDIASMTSEHRDDAIDALADSDASLHQRWVRYKAAQDRMAWWAKTSDRYTRTNNEPNTYILFTEHAADLAGGRGHVGLVVKTGICADEGPSEIWQQLVDAGRVREVRDIVNSGPGGVLVFPDVAPVERFCVLVLGPERGDTTFEASMLNYGVESARDRETRTWDRDLLTTINPVTRTLPSPASNEELDVLIDLHRTNPTLSYADPDEGNPWGLVYHRLFDSSIAKKDGLLLRREALEVDGWVMREDRVMVGPDTARTDGPMDLFSGTDQEGDGGQVLALPVYEGQMANIWDHRRKTFEGYTGKKKYGPKPHLPEVIVEQHADPGFEIEPRYWMYQRHVIDRLAATAGDDALIAFRNVGAVWTNRRSAKAALFPRYPALHGLPVFSAPRDRVFGALAVLNSLSFDFVVRSHIPGANMSSWILSQCAAPPPADVPEEAAVLAQRLSVTSRSVAASYDLQITRWDEEQRAVDMARLDVLIARAYGLDLAGYTIVLDHFDQLHRMETKELGEPRTRRLCLAAWDGHDNRKG